jgi:hypothetical protein
MKDQKCQTIVVDLTLAEQGIHQKHSFATREGKLVFEGLQFD